MKKVSFFSLIFLLIISCSEMETVIDLEIPAHEPVLVLNGILDTDSSIKVSVSHSAGAFANANPSFIDDADALLFENGDLTYLHKPYVEYYPPKTAESGFEGNKLAEYKMKEKYFVMKNGIINKLKRKEVKKLGLKKLTKN